VGFTPVHAIAVPADHGTDVMVELTFDLRQPGTLPDFGRITELGEWDVVGGSAHLGTTVPYTRVVAALAGWPHKPSSAVRAVDSPRARPKTAAERRSGWGTAAWDARPTLLASGAVVDAEAFSGSRRVLIEGPPADLEGSALTPDELIRAVLIPTSADSMRSYADESRGTAVSAVCSFALALDLDRRSVGTGIGSTDQVPLAARIAERFLAGALNWSNLDLPVGAAHRFGVLVAEAAGPVGDGYDNAAYQRRVLALLATRALRRIRAAASVDRYGELSVA
jgi:CO/xanthine dehydrogenase FAD-binding subunit